MNPLKKFLFELQEITLLIVLLTGFFTGGVLILQTFPTLQYYSIQNEAGRSVATSR